MLPAATRPGRTRKILAQAPAAAALGLVLLLPRSTPAQAGRTQGQGAPDRAAALLRSVEDHYAGLPGLKADFVQIWRPGRFSGTVEERGTLWIRKPGLARWEYFEPERKLALVTPDRETWFYLPSEEEAFHGRLREGRLPVHLALLVGEADLTDAFRVVDSRFGEADAEKAGLAVLTLEPKERRLGMSGVVLTVETDSGRVDSIVVEGEGGEQTEYILSDVQEGFEAPESLFRFQPPEGVSVMERGTGEDPGGAGAG